MGRKKKPTSKTKRRRSGKKEREKDAGQPSAMPPQAASDAAEVGPSPEANEPTEEPLTTSAEVEPVTRAAPEEPEVIEAAIIDLDEVDEAGGPEDVQRLIAQTLAIDLDEEFDTEPDAPAIDLDADLDAEPHLEALPLDARVDDSEPKGEPASGATPQPTVAEPAPAARSPADASGAETASEPEPTESASEAEAADAARRAADLGPVSSPAIRDRLLAEALAHAEHQDARYRVPFAGSTSAARWKLLAAGIMLLLAGLTAVAPPGWARPDPPVLLDSAARAHSLRVALVLQAQQIEAFRVRTQRLPAALDEVGATLPGIRYVRSGNRAYQLIAYESDGNAIVYDSASPIDGPGTLDAAWAAPEITP